MQKAHGHRVEADDERQGTCWESPPPHGQQDKPQQEASIPQHAEHAQSLPHPAGRPGDAAAPPEIDDRMGNLGQKRACGQHPGEGEQPWQVLVPAPSAGVRRCRRRGMAPDHEPGATAQHEVRGAE